MPDETQAIRFEVVQVGYIATRQMFDSLDDAVLYAYSLMSAKVVTEVRIRGKLPDERAL